MDLDLVFVHKKQQRWERGNLFPPVRSICPVCPVRPVRSIRSGTVVVLPAAAFVLYTQLNILFCQGLWRLSLLACDMLSRLSLSEEKEKLFLNWTEPFPELSFCPVRLKLVFFRCFGLRFWFGISPWFACYWCCSAFSLARFSTRVSLTAKHWKLFSK